MPMRVLFLCVHMVLIVGCTNTNVHLYARYLNDEEQQTLVKLLQKQALTVHVNQHVFPNEVTETSMVYSPFISSSSTVLKIETLMERYDWPVSNVSALVAGQHWFNKDSIGLFVVPKGVNPQAGKSAIDLSLTYESELCQQLIKLALFSDGRYRFSQSIGNDKYDFGISGQWRISSFPYIEMKPENKGRGLYFEVVKSVRQDKVSFINITTLKPIERYSGIESCAFSSGERIYP